MRAKQHPSWVRREVGEAALLRTGLVMLGVMAGLCACGPAPGPDPSSLEFMEGACEEENESSRRKWIERQRAQAAVDDAEIALSSDSAAVQDHYRSSMEQQAGLAPGEGAGWRDSYAAQKSVGERQLAEIGEATLPWEGSACKAYAAKLKAVREGRSETR